MFCGWLELIASLLILFNRTRVAGGVLMMIALVQVVCFNIFYNNNVILLSGILLLATIFVIAKALPKLFEIFIKLKPVSLAQHRYKFSTSWKKYAMIALCFLPAWKVFVVTKRGWTFYKGLLYNQERQSLYNVAIFQYGNDTILPLLTDTLRWRYVCFLDYTKTNQKMVIFDMRENQDVRKCRWDTLSKKIILLEKEPLHFSYTSLPGNNMLLNGFWQGKATKIQLTKLNIDSMNLVKDKFLFMQEDQ